LAIESISSLSREKSALRMLGVILISLVMP
jgi:hypothetical protein